jgi:hypothetical protein
MRWLAFVLTVMFATGLGVGWALLTTSPPDRLEASAGVSADQAIAP